uniref:Uncharacterized protein n=1 Tax=Rhizophagus irregularis (strain DAOM 181602 / DAOM 197198 / MUCL 43194) TaxID=747089 RepID=U9U308_RHIID
MLNNLIEFETYLGQLREISKKKQQKTSLEIHDLLETQLEELNNNDVSSIIAIATFNLGNLKKFASAISSRVFGGTALHKIINIKRLQKFIGEHNEVQKTIKGPQEFLNVVQKICR